MELTDKLIKIVSGYNRVQYGIALRQLATMTNIINERRKINSTGKVIDNSMLTTFCAIRQGEPHTVKEIDYEILNDRKPNPPIA